MNQGEWRDFESQIFFKENAGEILGRDLTRILARAKPGKEPSIAIGTVTDPYQPVEERLVVTRSILEALLKAETAENLQIQVTTKSDLILRDLDLLEPLSRRGPLSINITVTTLSYDLSRVLEPRAPSSRRRLDLLRALRKAGIRAGVFLMPLIPGINDTREAIDSLAREVKSAGALYLAEAPLLLRPQGFEPFFRFLRREYPQLDRAYHEAFEASARVPEAYRAKIRRLVGRVRKAAGLLSWPAEKNQPRRRRPGSARSPTPTLRQLEIPGL